MKYLDEHIEVAVDGITVSESKSYIYRVCRGDGSVLFTGNVFLIAGDTEKVFDITDFIITETYVNKQFTGVSSKIIENYYVELYIGDTPNVSDDVDVYLAYRYPHFLKRLQIDESKPFYLNLQPGLTPIYPKEDYNTTKDTYKINITYTDTTFADDDFAFLMYNDGNVKFMKQFTPTEITNVESFSNKEMYNWVESDVKNKAYFPIIDSVTGPDEQDVVISGNNRDFRFSNIGLGFKFGYYNNDDEFTELFSYDGADAEESETQEWFLPTDVNEIAYFAFLVGGNYDTVIRYDYNQDQYGAYTCYFETTLVSTLHEDIEVNGFSLSGLTTEEKGLTLTIVPDIEDNWNKYTYKLVDFCDNLDGYYLQWQDRMGGLQSQHFTGYPKFTNTYNRTDIINYKGNKRPINNEITSKWVINSNWITDDDYPYYESIFTSPYLKLYDVKEDKLYDVNIIDSEFVEKTFHNQGRQMFNLQLNLEKSNKQSITY